MTAAPKPVANRRQTPKQFEAEYRKFFEMIGHCITRWAYVEEALFDLCHWSLATDKRLASVVFYRTPTLDSRISLTGELLEASLLKGPLKSGEHRPGELVEWGKLDKRLIDLKPFRNFLAHQPIVITTDRPAVVLVRTNPDGTYTQIRPKKGSPEAVPPRTVVKLRVTPNERPSKRAGKLTEIGIDHLKAHYDAVEVLLKQIWGYRKALLAMRPAEPVPLNTEPKSY